MFDFFINGCKMVIFYDLYIRVNIFNFIDVVVDLSDNVYVYVCLNVVFILIFINKIYVVFFNNFFIFKKLLIDYMCFLKFNVLLYYDFNIVN